MKTMFRWVNAVMMVAKSKVQMTIMIVVSGLIALNKGYDVATFLTVFVIYFVLLSIWETIFNKDLRKE